MRKNVWLQIGTVLGFVLTSCSVPETGERVSGTIAHFGDPVQTEVPAQVARGEPFTVSVVTYGGGCLYQGDTEVRVEGLRAEVTPYNRDTSQPGITCTADLRLYTHTATLSFGEAGTAEVVFYGLEKDWDGTRDISFIRRLEVR